MFFKVSWDDDFDTLMMHLWAKYGKEMFTVDGIGEQMDLHKFSKKFFNEASTTADVSVDANANVTQRTGIEYNFELAKPLRRYNSYFNLWKQLRKDFGLELANHIIESQINGTIYINDATDTSQYYCYNYSTNDIRYNGLIGLADRPVVQPPKSLDVFFRQVEQFIVIAANSSLGASGCADLFIVASDYVERILDTGYDGHIYIGKDKDKVGIYIREKIVEIIYTLNWAFRGNQSPFTNVSVFDSVFLEKLCPDYGVKPETVKWVQKIYIEAMNKELERTVLTFPVTTACFATDDENNLVDKKFCEYIAKQNLKYGFINIYYGKTSTLSSCCFSGDTEVEVASVEEYELNPVRMRFADIQEKLGKEVMVYNGQTWLQGFVVELPADRDMYEIAAEKTESFICTDNHLHMLVDGTYVETTVLAVGDKLKSAYTEEGVTIQSIRKLADGEYTQDKVYCFEMKNQNMPYFQLANGIITHNCRLRSNTDNPYFNSFGAGSSKIGSIGVVTVSFPRAAMKAVEAAEASLDPEKKEQFFLENLRELFDMECMVNAAKRKLIQKRIDLGAAPMYSLGFVHMKTQYSTFGINGLNEAVSIMGYDILTKEGQEFVERVLKTIDSWVTCAQDQYKAPHNVEQTPSEGSAVKLATKDKMMGYDCGVPFYSNQFIPLTTQANMLDRIRLQGKFDNLMSGGAICHVNVSERIEDCERLIELMHYAAKCGVVYWAINYLIRTCEDHHTWVGSEKCPVCGKHYSDEITRVVGFFTNVKHWNPTRRKEDWPNRQFYKSI